MAADVVLHPVSDQLRSAIWSVERQPVRTMRQDDPAKAKRAVRAYRQAAQKLLDVALAEHQSRQAGSGSHPDSRPNSA